MLAFEEYEASLCACGQPKALAWHGEMDGWFEHEGFVCHACTAQQGRQVVYGRTVDTRTPEARSVVLSPLQIGVTTTPPDNQRGSTSKSSPADRSIA